MSDAVAPQSGFVVLTEESNPMWAHVIAGALENEGIKAFVQEDNLADEFAVSQKAMGLQGARVFVPVDRLDEARTIFLKLSRPIPEIDEDDEFDDTDEQVKLSTRATLIVVLVGVALFSTLIVLLEGCQ